MNSLKENSNHALEEKKIWDLLKEVNDPEVPVLSIVDLGIVRDVKINTSASRGNLEGEVTITPTYSGCPAMDVITTNIRMKLLEHGYRNMIVSTILSPAWTTEWMSSEGKEKLKAFGIAPPNPLQSVCSPGLFAKEEAVQCPHCDSHNTQLISQFGSTACKAIYRCSDCLEPFDYFKCH